MDIYFQQSAQPMVIYFTGGFNFNSYVIGGGGLVADGDYGDITVNGAGSNWFINTGVIESGNLAARTVTFDKLPEIGAYKFLGRHNGTVGDIQEIGIDGGLEFHGSKLRRSAITGDINIDAGDGASILNVGVVESGNLAARNVTFDKIIEFPAFRILGRPTGTAGDAQFIGIDNSLEFNSGNLRRAALTGDISASAGSNITSLTTGIITVSHFGSGISQAGIDLITGVNNTAQRNSLGLGSAAIANTGDFAAFLHTHPLSGIDQSGATTGQVAQWNGSIWAPATSAGGGVDEQRFTTTGTHTWTNPSPLVRKLAHARIVGGGGGGGSGRKGATGTVRCGGGGGGGAGVNDFWFWTDLVPATLSVVVGAGGSGGASVSADSTNGNSGLVGLMSTLGGWRGWTGNGGSGGTSATGLAGAAGGSVSLLSGIVQNSAGGGAASVTGGVGGTAANQNSYIPTGGGAGGGITSGNVASTGGHGGTCGSLYTAGQWSGQGYGGSPGLNGQQGPNPISTMGFGGGGGGGATVLNGGNGANGNGPGAGGGGGGAATDGIGDSGAGGNGSDGSVEVIVFL